MALQADVTRRGLSAWAALAALGLASLAGYVALWALADRARSPQAVNSTIIVFGGLFALYLAACTLVLRRAPVLPVRATLALIAGVAVAARALLVLAPPTLSDDMYRYIWDGRVQAAGLSPYAYPPGAPQVAALHPPDDPIWPHINRKGAITIYPPGAEVFFAGVYRLGPESLTAMKAALAAVDLAVGLALALLLARLGLSPLRGLVYAWAPLPIVEFAGSGHVEVLEGLLTALALLAGVAVAQRSGRDAAGRRSGPALLAAAWLAGAALVKLIPLLLLAGWARFLGPKLLALCLGLFVLGYGGFVLATGGHVSPFLVTYLRDETSNAPLYLFLAYVFAPLVGLPDSAIRLALLGGLAGVALRLAFKADRGPYDFIGKSFLLVGAYLLLATNAHPWYATWLLVFVPLLLPPRGLPLFGDTPDAEGARWRGGDYGPALAALLYGGLTFAGYVVFAWRVPVAPAPVVALQGGVVLALGVFWPLLGRRHAR